MRTHDLWHGEPLEIPAIREYLGTSYALFRNAANRRTLAFAYTNLLMDSRIMQTHRYDIYANIHKALRACFSHTLTSLGRLDWSDDEDVDAAMQEVCGLLAMCRSHLAKENAYVHPAMEARRPGSTARIAGEHVEHERDIAALEAQVFAARNLPGNVREQYMRWLYRELSRFIAHNLEHMLYEESEHNRLLWDACSDDEIRTIEMNIVASIPPEESGPLLTRWMLPALAPEERTRFLQGVRFNAPPQVFNALVDGLMPQLSSKDRMKLQAALDLQPALQSIVRAA